MTVIIMRWQIEEQSEKAVKAGPCFTQLRAGSGMETRKWVRNVGFATRAMLGAQCLSTEVKIDASKGPSGWSVKCQLRGAQEDDLFG
jgi:hypothetical protein